MLHIPLLLSTPTEQVEDAPFYMTVSAICLDLFS